MTLLLRHEGKVHNLTEILGCESGPAWGYGSYVVEFADGPEPMYGLSRPGHDPRNWEPDHETNTPEEIAAWERARDIEGGGVGG